MKRLIVALALTGLLVPATFAMQGDAKDAPKTEKKKKTSKKGAKKKSEAPKKEG